MKNFNSIISGLSKSGVLSGFAGGVAGGAVSGALMSKRGRGAGKTALKLGALAAVGGVAWKAYQAYSQKNAQRAPQPTPQGSHYGGHQPAGQSQYIPSQPQQQLTYSPDTLSKRQFEQGVAEQNNDSGHMLLMRAMIAAANADGHIDEGERERIYNQVEQFELSTQEKASLFDELRNPLKLEQLVSAVPNSEMAIEVYTASVLAIDEQQPQAQDYLNKLSGALMIPRELVQAIHEQVPQMDQI